MSFSRRGNDAFLSVAFPSPAWIARVGLLGALVGFRPVALARVPLENFVELQALRFSLGTVKLEDSLRTGGTETATLKSNGLATFPNRVNFVGHYADFAIQLTHDFSEPGRGYFSFGYVFSPLFELGLGANAGWADKEDLDKKNAKVATKTTNLAVGPYALANLPTDIGELELRWEVDYEFAKQEVKASGASIKTADASGFETDFDARFVFRVSPKIAFTSGANVFYKAMTDKSPNSAAYSKSKRTDLVFGLNLLGARFSF